MSLKRRRNITSSKNRKVKGDGPNVSRKNLGYSNYKGIIYILNHSYGETETEKYFKFRKMYIGEGINEQFSVPTSDFFIAGKYAKTIIGAGKINDELLESLKTH